MRPFAEFITALSAAGRDRDTLIEAYLAKNPAAMPLVFGPAPLRLIAPGTLRAWIAEATDLPAAMIDACRKATGDLQEALALILPPTGTGPEPDLSTIMADMSALPPGPLARAAILATAHRLPPDTRTLYFRLLTGAFRPLIPAMQRDVAPKSGITPTHHQVLAVMIYAEAALSAGACGPEITLAVWSDDILVPIARVQTRLPPEQTTALLAWVRAHAIGRFGPLRAVPAQQVFQLSFSAMTHNRRRKSGLSLTNPAVVAWLSDRSPNDATTLANLTALAPITA